MPTSTDLNPHLAWLRTLCAPFPQAEEYTMVHHPAFRVGKKPFVILGGADEAQLSIKVPVMDQPLYLEDPRFSKTPYIGQHGWVTFPIAAMSEGEVKRLIDLSYRGVAPKRAIAALDAAQQG